MRLPAERGTAEGWLPADEMLSLSADELKEFVDLTKGSKTAK
jgi:hypothetical protein